MFVSPRFPARRRGAHLLTNPGVLTGQRPGKTPVIAAPEDAVKAGPARDITRGDAVQIEW